MPCPRSLWRCVAVLVLLAASPSGAVGPETTGNEVDVYIEYTVGISFPPNQNLWAKDPSPTSATPPLTRYSGRLELDPGYVIGGAIGLRFLESFRAELNLGYRNSENDKVTTLGEPDGGRGDLELFTAMLNGYFDYDFGIGVIPFIGAGIGYGLLETSAETRGGLLKINDDESVFAYNVMVGATVPLSDVVDVVGGYRYLATTDAEFSGRIIDPNSRPQAFDSEYDTHELTFGLRVNF